MTFSFCTKQCCGFVSNLTAISALVLSPISLAYAAGDAAQGQHDFEYTCRHCHGSPQPGKPGAFSDFDITANRLSVYASDPAAITKAANEGYIIPDGNSNNDYPPGARTTEAMNSFSGTGAKKFGTGTTPTPYVINISAYFASMFPVPDSPTIGTVKVGNAQATVNFTAPKSELTITSYTVIANPGDITASGISSPIIVSGLTNGTAYTFTVSATSNAGSSKPSSASNSVTPIASVAAVTPISPVKVAPGITGASQPALAPQTKATAPTPTPVVTANQTKAVIPAVPIVPATQAKIIVPVVPITPPAPAAPVAQAKVATPAVSVLPSVQVKAAVPIGPVAAPVPALPVAPVAQAKVTTPTTTANPATANPVPVTKMPVAPPTVAATNNIASTKATPQSNQTAQKIVLQTPTMKMARAGSASARVFFGAPAENATITGYTVSALSGGAPTGITATGTKSPITISGLTNGSTYTFTVTANSSTGVSEASEQSNSVTPLKILGD